MRPQSSKDSRDRSNTLYRFFGDDDALLYVGITCNLPRRMEKHRGEKPWWTSVRRIEMEEHADRATLRAAERAAIEAEQPRYNIRMNGRPNPRRGAHPLSKPEPREGARKEVRYRTGGTRLATLYLTYEVDGDPMSDDWLPEEISAQDLFARWERWVHERDDCDERSLGVYWFVAAEDAGIFESACPDNYHGVHDTWFETYFELTDGSAVRDIPVRPKNWTKHGDKGGFITEAHGWVPAPFQHSVSLADLRSPRP